MLLRLENSNQFSTVMTQSPGINQLLLLWPLLPFSSGFPVSAPLQVGQTAKLLVLSPQREKEQLFLGRFCPVCHVKTAPLFAKGHHYAKSWNIKNLEPKRSKGRKRTQQSELEIKFTLSPIVTHCSNFFYMGNYGGSEIKLMRPKKCSGNIKARDPGHVSSLSHKCLDLLSLLPMVNQDPPGMFTGIRMLIQKTAEPFRNK
ncbi:Zinc Finger Matrin-Type Protein 1 [Manis pentadactyla]|nr:Zinc Finger Matrin-Type Protein 1 [Manis pentadactyla]